MSLPFARFMGSRDTCFHKLSYVVQKNDQSLGDVRAEYVEQVLYRTPSCVQMSTQEKHRATYRLHHLISRNVATNCLSQSFSVPYHVRKSIIINLCNNLHISARLGFLNQIFFRRKKDKRKLFRR